MNQGEKPNKVEDDIVVSLEYTVKVNDDVVDTSQGREPIQFIQGKGQIISGLERELYNMSIGDSKDVVVAAEDGYGEEDPNAFADIPRSEFSDEIPLSPGVELQLKNQDGEVLQAFIHSVGKDTVRLDFNHPLAGKELHFSVKVIDLRSPTQEELSHGHVHHGHEH